MPSFYISQVARSTPFDNTTNGFVSTDVQAAIEEIGNGVRITASPGFCWGRSGSVTSGAYLLNEGVPSNLTGRVILLTSCFITNISVANEDTGSFTMMIQEHDGTTYTDLQSITVTSAKSNYLSGLSVAVTSGKQLAVKVSSGSPKNPVVTVMLRGLI